MIEQLVAGSGISQQGFLFLALFSGVTSFVSALFGVGGGAILLGVMTLWMPPAALVPVHGMVQLGSNGFRALLLITNLEKSILLPFVAGTVVGSIASGSLLLQFPDWVMQLMIAGFLIWTVFGKSPAFGKQGAMFAGGFSGFLTMMVGATGPFVSGFVKAMNLAPVSHVATSAVLMTFQHLLKLIVFGVLGFAFQPYWKLIAAMILVGFVGTFLGKKLLVRISAEKFRVLLNIVLIVLAVRLLITVYIDLAN